jgi:hypothetical protein
VTFLSARSRWRCCISSRSASVTRSVLKASDSEQNLFYNKS